MSTLKYEIRVHAKGADCSVKNFLVICELKPLGTQTATGANTQCAFKNNSADKVFKSHPYLFQESRNLIETIGQM